MKFKSTFTLILLAALIIPQSVNAQQAISSKFDPNQLISNKDFSNSDTFDDADEIQDFLESQNSILANTSSDFLAMLREPVGQAALKDQLEDPTAGNSKKRTAAQIIWDVSQVSGINPQVLLVTLNKEQSLIVGHQSSSADRIQRALDFAMGFGCPDTAPCGALYKGFYFQLWGNVDGEGNRYLGAAGSLMKSFKTSGGRGPFYNGSVSKVGDTIILNNTLGGYVGVQASQSITLKNEATAALYRYTPHVFNGNYNFWRFFNDWFGGSTSNSNDSKDSKSSSKDSNLKEGTVLRGKEGPAVYVVEDGILRLVSWLVFQQRGLQDKIVYIDDAVLAKYKKGGFLPPAEGTLMRSPSDPTVYLIVGREKRPITLPVFSTYGFTFNDVHTLTDDEMAALPKGKIAEPKDGAVYKVNETGEVYQYQDGESRFMSGIVALQYGASNAYGIPKSEHNEWKEGDPLLPRDNTLLKGASATVYIVEKGKLKAMTEADFKKRNLSPAGVVTIPQTELDKYLD
ncbi:MAG: hypothetical protein R3B41_00055 [Candidatus Doudnabacteria bacterium]